MLIPGVRSSTDMYWSAVSFGEQRDPTPIIRGSCCTLLWSRHRSPRMPFLGENRMHKYASCNFERRQTDISTLSAHFGISVEDFCVKRRESWIERKGWALYFYKSMLPMGRGTEHSRLLNTFLVSWRTEKEVDVLETGGEEVVYIILWRRRYVKRLTSSFS